MSLMLRPIYSMGNGRAIAAGGDVWGDKREVPGIKMYCARKDPASGVRSPYAGEKVRAREAPRVN